MNGYMGKILRVDLSTRSIATEPLQEEIARKFIGGRGLSAKILFDELKPGIDPLGPENRLVVATGWDMTMNEYMDAGERAINLTRAFNAREGLTRDDDTLPKRLMEPLPDGAFAGKPFGPEILGSMLDDYYQLRGWDKKTGLPTRATLHRVGLNHVADELGKMKLLPN